MSLDYKLRYPRLAFSVMVFVCCPVFASQWSRFESPHMTVLSENDKLGGSVINELEHATNAFKMMGLPISQTKPITILLVSNQSTLREAWPANNGETGALGGLTYSFEDRVYVLADMSRPEARKNLLHEYVHALVGQSYTGLPRWIDEGIAEHYSTLSISNSRAYLGPLDARRRWSQGSCSPSISLLKVASDDTRMWNSSEINAYYHTAAISVRYLIERYGIERVYAFMNSVKAGAAEEESLRAAFNASTTEISTSAERFCKSGTLSNSVALEPSEIQAVRTNATEREFQYAYSDILARIAGHQEDAIRILQSVLNSDKEDPWAQRGIGIALTYKGDFDGAVPHLQIALEKLKGDPTTLYHLIIACSNSTNCRAEQYLEQATRLLALNPDLQVIRRWQSQMKETSGDDSPFLPDKAEDSAPPPKKD